MALLRAHHILHVSRMRVKILASMFSTAVAKILPRNKVWV